MLRQSGILVPETQVREIIKEMKEVFKRVGEKHELKKIIFLGDLKHSFGFEFEEKNYFRKLMDFLKENFKEENIIFIKGNHDTVDYSFEKKLIDYYVEEGIIFIHGDKPFLEIFDNKIEMIVMGHLHPSIILSDKQGIKKERYKCFLVGKLKKREVVVLPSFLSLVEGDPINNYEENYEDSFSIIPKKELMKFKVFVIGEEEVYEFGKLKDLI